MQIKYPHRRFYRLDPIRDELSPQAAELELVRQALPAVEARQSRLTASHVLNAYTIRPIEPVRYIIDVPFSRKADTYRRLFHAGRISLIADSADGYSTLMLMPPGNCILIVEFKINISPANGEKFSTEGKVVKSVCTLMFTTVNAAAFIGGICEPCAIVRHTCACLISS